MKEKLCLPKVISKLDAYLMNSFSSNITFQLVIFGYLILNLATLSDNRENVNEKNLDYVKSSKQKQIHQFYLN